MKITINDKEYFFQLLSEYPEITLSKKSSIFQQSMPHLYKLTFRIASEKKLSDYPEEILGRVVGKAILKGLEEYQ
jgi:hypothetical protein